MMAIGAVFFFFQAEDGIRDYKVTGVQTCALPIYRIRKCRDELEDIGHDAVVGDLEDIGVWILVHRDDDLARGHAREMLDRARDAESDVEVWRDSLPGLPDLLLVRPPSGVRDGTGRSHGA